MTTARYTLVLPDGCELHFYSLERASEMAALQHGTTRIVDEQTGETVQTAQAEKEEE